MEYFKNILFFIIFASAGTFSTQSITSSIKHDITILLNDSIAAAFENMYAESIKELILKMENHNSTSLEKEIPCKIESFENKFYFTGINVTLLEIESVHVQRDFCSDKMTIFSPKLLIRLDAYLGATNGTVLVGFMRFVQFEMFSLTASRDALVEGLFHITISQDNYVSDYAYWPWFHQDVKPETRVDLEQQIILQLPSLLLQSLTENENFLYALHYTFCAHPEKKINSTYPDFMDNKDQYYYLIPNITSLRRTLSNITLRGLSNFQTHVFHVVEDQAHSNLVIGGIKGEANLYYDTSDRTIFPLEFEIYRISINLNREMGLVHVEAHDYSVTEAKSNEPLTEAQSKWIMEGIQLAIASSIMPSMKFYSNRNESTNRNVNHPITKIMTTISHQFQQTTMNELSQRWSSAMPNITKLESNFQFEGCDYNISFDTNMATVMSFLHLYTIHCNFYSYLEIIGGTDSRLPPLGGKIQLRNGTHFFDDIDFLTSQIAVFIIKRNNSKEINEEDLRVGVFPRVSSKKHNFTTIQWQVIEDVTKETMASAVKKIIAVYAELLLSLPLDYCTSPVKIFDDFIPFFADNELPYSVPDIDEATATEELFVSKIHNVEISGWEMYPRVNIIFNRVEKNQLLPIIYMELMNAKIRLEVDDTLFRFKQLEFTHSSVSLTNNTDGGGIRVQVFNDLDPLYVRRMNGSRTSRHELRWIQVKLEYLIKKSLE